MDDTADPPPPYPGTDPGQYSMQTPAVGQTNNGFSNPTYPGYAPQQQSQFVGQQQSNIVVAQVGGGNVYNEPLPPDYTTQAWIACLCCFWPTGLVAILKAMESRDALALGDLQGARAAASSARQMVRISYIVGTIGVVITVVMIGVIWGVVINSTSTCYDNNYDDC